MSKTARFRGYTPTKAYSRHRFIVSNAGIQPTVLKLVGEEHFDKSYANHIRELVPSLGLMGSRYFLNKVVFEDNTYIIYSDDS